MYTLRKMPFEGEEKGKVVNIFLGRYYTVDKRPQIDNPDLKEEVRIMVTGEYESHYIFKESGFVCIMTESGSTFEVLQK